MDRIASVASLPRWNQNFNRSTIQKNHSEELPDISTVVIVKLKKKKKILGNLTIILYESHKLHEDSVELSDSCNSYQSSCVDSLRNIMYKPTPGGKKNEP